MPSPRSLYLAHPTHSMEKDRAPQGRQNDVFSSSLSALPCSQSRQLLSWHGLESSVNQQEQTVATVVRSIDWGRSRSDGEGWSQGKRRQAEHKALALVPLRGICGWMCICMEQLHTPALEDTALSRGCWSNAQAVTGWRSEEEDVEETRGIRNRNPHCPHLPSGRAPTSRSCSPGVEECKVAKSLSRWTSQMASSSSAARVV